MRMSANIMQKHCLIAVFLFLVLGLFSCKWLERPSNDLHETSLEYEFNFPESLTDLEKKRNIANNTAEIIRRRLEKMDIAEPRIYRIGLKSIIVSVPSGKDLDQIHDTLKQPGKLEFRMVDDSLSEKEVASLVENARINEKIPAGSVAENAEKINKALKDKIPADDEIAFEIDYDPTTNKIVMETPMLLKKKAVLTGERISYTDVSIDQAIPKASVTFDEVGKKILAEVTSKNIGKRLAVVNDGIVLKAPIIGGVIPSGKVSIGSEFGNYKTLLEEATDLSIVLFSGGYPNYVKVRKIQTPP